MACPPLTRRSALELVREACEQANDASELTPERVLPVAGRADLEDVERALALLDTLALLSERVAAGASANAAARERAEVNEREHELRAARDALVLAVRRLDAARARLGRHESYGGRAAIADVLAAFEQVEEIERLPPVRAASLTTRSDQLALLVELHPLVIGDAGVNRLIGPLTFTLVEAPATVRFAAPDGSPHPHVHGHGSPCLGQAAEPVHAALARGELATAVFLIIGWARQVNRADCVANPSQWPRTRLAAGWHP